MKTLIALSLAMVLGISLNADAKPNPMKKVAKTLIGHGKLSDDYSLKNIEKIDIRGTRFQTRLNTLTGQAVRQWKKLLDSEEYDHLTPEKRRQALADPAAFLGVPYLIEIQEIDAVYLNGELIGYVVDTADHVQAAVYQDGAGIKFFLDVDMKVVAEDEWSA